VTAPSNISTKREKTGAPSLKLENPGPAPSSSGYPAWMTLVYDASDASLNAQDARVKKIVQQSFIFLWASFSWVDAYPDVKTMVEFMQKGLAESCKVLEG
jgi:hypothetical protein